MPCLIISLIYGMAQSRQRNDPVAHTVAINNPTDTDNQLATDEADGWALYQCQTDEQMDGQTDSEDRQ